MATYNAFITSKAIRSFSDLPPKLVAAHRAFDPSTPLSDIKVITIYLHNTTGNWLYVGGSGSDGMDYRYIRIVIDIPAMTKDAAQKEDLMRRTLEACMDYVGKKAEGTEIEVLINEVKPEDVMKISPSGRR